MRVPVLPLFAAIATSTPVVAQAQAASPLVIETVTVGNPGNPGETQDEGIFGAVDYEYAIGRYEVTAGQYAGFLNAVAATDRYALYNVRMWTHAEGCKIERIGSPGSYAYRVAPDWANRPVNFVSWGDAARFANWLHNGQPTGVQDLTITEDGSYFLDGRISDLQLEDVVREPDATWVIPTENEWYKAAYHKNDGVTGNYFSYPTSHDAGVSNDLVEPDPGNNATISRPIADYTIGPPYYRTEVGAHENSASPYGTFDQGGNVQEFNEAVPLDSSRGVRGGSWFWGTLHHAAERPLVMHSSDELSDLGFRVATLADSLPAPSNLAATALSETQIFLSWQDNSNSEESFVVEEREEGSSFEVIWLLEPDEEDVLVFGLRPGTTYAYRVKARHAAGDSAYSNVATATTTSSPGCSPTQTSLCLLDGRFRVEVDWRNFDDETGSGRVVDLGPFASGDSGLLYFFGPDNWEMLVKMVDACNSPFNSFWVFAAATTNVQYTLQVTDTLTGAVRLWVNPLGTQAAAIVDSAAFLTCP